MLTIPQIESGVPLEHRIMSNHEHLRRLCAGLYRSGLLTEKTWRGDPRKSLAVIFEPMTKIKSMLPIGLEVVTPTDEVFFAQLRVGFKCECVWIYGESLQKLNSIFPGCGFQIYRLLASAFCCNFGAFTACEILDAASQHYWMGEADEKAAFEVDPEAFCDEESLIKKSDVVDKIPEGVYGSRRLWSESHWEELACRYDNIIFQVASELRRSLRARSIMCKKLQPQYDHVRELMIPDDVYEMKPSILFGWHKEDLLGRVADDAYQCSYENGNLDEYPFRFGFDPDCVQSVKQAQSSLDSYLKSVELTSSLVSLCNLTTE